MISSAVIRAAARRAVMAMAGLALALPASVGAQGDLLVAPTRVIINGGGSAEVVLNNIGATPATYRIGLQLKRMTPDGFLENFEEGQATPQERAALDMIRYAPRRVQLPPNQPQSIRISARPPAELPDGEYRVHMVFRAIPDARPAEAPQDAPESGFSIRLTPIYGITIPLIVRKGQLTGGATIGGASVVSDGGAKHLKLQLARSGTRSVYGEVRVLAPGVKEPVFLARGIAVYAELAARAVDLPLSPEQAARLRGPVTIEYREMPEAGGRLIASAPANL